MDAALWIAEVSFQVERLIPYLESRNESTNQVCFVLLSLVGSTKGRVRRMLLEITASVISLQGIKHWFENRNGWYGCDFQLCLLSMWVTLFPIKMPSSEIRGVSPSSSSSLMKFWKHDKPEGP